ncbi:hypothetical protein PV10_03056 [Exophiala mesophila]|uniref:Uncharacterized protein n=1 Tax=Exophiala mesophila TaxID=212818 RepID=A0A0D1ZL85_EXOME|nr:uncharacterized protein PV10_03056 [Exophiala mesophila]KIV95392.1 hypothetical protein PV10_03056 [Exophiala mesophila]
MSDSNGPPSPRPQHRRRSSIVDMFNPRPNSNSLSSSPPSHTVPSTPSVPQHRRGASITSLGLTTNPAGQSPYNNAFARQRRASIATSSASGSPDFRNSFGDEPAVIEEDDSTSASLQPPPSPSFARRVSFGAQALRDVRLGTSPSNTGNTGGGEGFNWSEAIRDRSKRSPSFSTGNPFASNTSRPRASSISDPAPPKEISKPMADPAPKLKKPDHLGERMLRGDFMMD